MAHSIEIRSGYLDTFLGDFMGIFNRILKLLQQFFFQSKPDEKDGDETKTPNPAWVSMINIAWFGKYGHGEGKHIQEDWPSEIDWDELDADFKRCSINNVQVIRAFIFENLDGLEKNDSQWQISTEALNNLKRIKHLFEKYDLRLQAVLFEFKNEETQPWLPDFLTVKPFQPVVKMFIEEMAGILWGIDLHNEIDYLHLERKQSTEVLTATIGAYRKIVKATDPEIRYTCSTGWRGGYWANRRQIGVEHLDFIDVHHYQHHHGHPWSKTDSLSLNGLEKLDKPILLGEYKSDDFDLYTSECHNRGFLGAAPWSIHHNFPISEDTWQKIHEFQTVA